MCYRNETDNNAAKVKHDKKNYKLYLSKIQPAYIHFC